MLISARDACGLLGSSCGTGSQWDVPLKRAIWDSREAMPEDLFACLPGEHVDGHDYAIAAVAKGASAVLAQKEIPDLNVPLIMVSDVTQALGKLATAMRTKTTAKVVCLTGTAGKTTLKDTLAHILSHAGATAATEKNHNNQIGMPGAILAASGKEKFWVLEAGINHPGDMDELGAIAKPDLAIILNVGPGHCAGLGDKGVAWHKARLLAHLAPGGKILANADYPDLRKAIAAHDCPVEWFGTANDPKTRFSARCLNAITGEMELNLAGRILKVKTPWHGEYGAEIAAAAGAAAYLLGMKPESIGSAMATSPTPDQRFRTRQSGDWLLIDDTYNANPLSMRRMLEAAWQAAKSKNAPLVAVLGEMGELGEEAPAWHRELGEIVGKLNPLAVFWKGGFLEDVQNGLSKTRPGFEARAFGADDELPVLWRQMNLPSGGVAIFKGSRANHLESALAKTVEMLEGAHVL